MSREMVRIGVATTVLPKAGARTAARRPILMFRRMAARATEIGARLALFHPLQVDWAQGTVQAWEPVSANQPSGPWVARKTALPDVIYDNVFVHLAIRGYTAKLRRYARQQGIPLFNPPMYSKWVMQRWLKTTEAGKYVPPAVLPRSGAQTLHTIDRWRDAYLKPVGGYGGMGVTRIQATADGKYRISVDRQRHGRRTRLVLTRQEVANYLQHRLKQQRHFLQQGLKLLTVGGARSIFGLSLTAVDAERGMSSASSQNWRPQVAWSQTSSRAENACRSVNCSLWRSAKGSSFPDTIWRSARSTSPGSSASAYRPLV
ncbi:hypothetical protein GCM10025857_33600 [Alicyclobacillus contaminans]|nr:hypothetical protein GCM10025857_33600 [Alicyclobacillus contaminans]